MGRGRGREGVVKEDKRRRLPRVPPLLTPKGLLLRALVLVVAFLVCHVLGLRVYTCVASGTPAEIAGSKAVAAVAGLVYIAAYFVTVMVVPVFVLGAGFLFALMSWVKRGT